MTRDVTAAQLWALKALVACGHDVSLVRAADDAPVVSQAGVMAAIVGARELRRQDERLERLFDAAPLRDWFAVAGIAAVDVASLENGAARGALGRTAPDVIASLAGLELVRGLAPLARRATVALALGAAAARAERQVIVRGIVEGRDEWIGVSIYAIEGGGAAPRVAWRSRPQLAPGDSGDEVVFRAQVEAVTGLCVLLDAYARGERPASSENGQTVGAPSGLWTWVRYIVSGRGRAARPAYERALR